MGTESVRWDTRDAHIHILIRQKAKAKARAKAKAKERIKASRRTEADRMRETTELPEMGHTVRIMADRGQERERPEAHLRQERR